MRPLLRMLDFASAICGAVWLVYALEHGWHYWAAVWAVWAICDLIDYGKR